MNRTAFYASVRRRTSGIFGTSLSQGQVNGCETLLGEAEKDGTPLRFLAYILATAYHETACTMQPVREIGKGKGRPYGKPVNGKIYYGRGYVQLTWLENYQRAAKELAVDLVRYPDDALEPDIAAAILFRGMTEGWFTGKKLSDYINLDKTDYFNARRIVNGTDRAQKIAGYAKAFETALREAAYASQAPKPKPMPSTVSTPSPAPPPSLTDAQKTAGVPVNQKAPESAPQANSGGKSVAIGAAGIIAFTAAFWATAEGWWAHLINAIQQLPGLF
jgi:hypothetical protein